jgi:hypothetical protein
LSIFWHATPDAIWRWNRIQSGTGDELLPNAEFRNNLKGDSKGKPQGLKPLSFVLAIEAQG